MELEQNPSRHRWTEFAVIAAILLAGLLLRYQRVGWDCISLDEMWHLTLSSGRGSPQISLPRDVLIENAHSITNLTNAPPWYSVWTHVERAVHPPLYVSTLRIWRELFGGGDRAAQWLSVVCSLVAVLLIWRAARRSFSPVVAAWSAGLMAVAPTQVVLGQEIRGYAMLMMWGCWALWAAARIEADGPTRGRLTELGLAVLAMMLTHYFAIGACVALGAWAIWRLRGRARRDTIGCLFMAAGVYGVIWGPWMFRQIPDAVSAGSSWLAEAGSNAPLLAVLRAAAVPLRLVADVELSHIAWPIIGASALIVPLAMARRQPGLWLWWLWAAGTIVLLAALDATRSTRHLLHIRYALLAAPAVYVMWVAVFSMLRPVGFHVAAAALAAGALWLSTSAYQHDSPDYPVLQRHLAAAVQPQDVLIFYSGEFVPWHNEALLLAASRRADLWPRSIMMLSGPLDSKSARALEGRTALVLSGPLNGPIDAIIPGARQVDQQNIVDTFDRAMAVVTRITVRAGDASSAAAEESR